MTSPFKVYSDFMALRAHFTTTKYNFITYKGSMKWITETSYEKRKDKYFFERLAKHKDYKDFLVANFSKKPKVWITELSKPKAEDIYTDWKKTMQSLTYIFRSDLRKLPDRLFDTLKCATGPTDPPPLLLQSYFNNDISLETFCILLDITEVKKFWDKKLTVPEWENLSHQVEKYTPFISFDKTKMKEIALTRFNDANLFIEMD